MVIKKVVSHLKWFIAVFPVGLFGFLTAWLMVIPAYYLADKKGFKWLSIWLDDEILYADSNADWLIYKESHKLAWYRWHAFRNTVWNLKEYIKPENARENCKYNYERIHQILHDDLSRNGQYVSVKHNCLEMANYKWIDKNGKEGWQVFSGDYISERFSTVGKSVLWYFANNKLYYRYSVAKEITLFGKKYYFEFRMGASEKRYLFILKLKKCKI